MNKIKLMGVSGSCLHNQCGLPLTGSISVESIPSINRVPMQNYYLSPTTGNIS